MNIWFLTGTALLIGAATAHSLLGEKVTLRRLYRHADDGTPDGRRASDEPTTRQTLRLTWHSLSVALLGYALLLLVAGLNVRAYANVGVEAVRVLAVVLLALALLSLSVARGRHVGWIWYAAAAVVTWVGAA